MRQSRWLEPEMVSRREARETAAAWYGLPATVTWEDIAVAARRAATDEFGLPATATWEEIEEEERRQAAVKIGLPATATWKEIRKAIEANRDNDSLPKPKSSDPIKSVAERRRLHNLGKFRGR